jgi:F0F1-type ATP synthase assembly protein I
MDIPADSTGAQRARWGSTVGKAVALQWAVVLALSLVTLVGFGSGAAQSMLFGGAAVALPNALLAAWLTLRVLRFGAAGVGALLGGELLKLGLTVALLAIGVKAYQSQVVWLALLVGVVAALKAQWLAVWFTRNS